MSEAPPRLYLDLSPMLFATALAKVLVGLGYEVDVGGPPDHHALAVLSEPGGVGAIPVQITLPPLEGNEIRAEVADAGGSRRVQVRNLADLLALIQGIVPTPRPAID